MRVIVFIPMYFVYNFNPFRQRKAEKLSARGGGGGGRFIKLNTKTSEFVVESGVMKVTDFNSDIQHP